MQNKQYDSGSKRLLDICIQDFLDWLAEGAVATGDRSVEFHSMSIDADAMHEATLFDQFILAHVEIQSGPDPDMEQRLLEYNVLSYRRYKRPVFSYVIFLKKGGASLKSPLVRAMPDGREVLRFHYQVILLRKISYKELLAKGLKGLYPLVPLAKGGAKREVVEEVIARLPLTGDTIIRELHALTYLFASLAFDGEKEHQEWIQGRIAMSKDFLADTPAYKFIMQMGWEEGQQKGMEEGMKIGIEKGIEKGMRQEAEKQLAFSRQMLLQFVQKRFPDLSKQTERKVAQIKELEAMNQLILKITLAQTVEEAHAHLFVEG